MNVTKDGFKNRQLHIEDYLQKVSAEQKEYAEVFDHTRITENNNTITDLDKEIAKLGYTSLVGYYLQVCEN